MTDELMTTLIGEVRALRTTIENQRSVPKEYFDREQAAQYLMMSVAKLDKLMASNEIKRAKLGETRNAIVLFRKRDLDDYVSRFERMTNEEARARVRNSKSSA